jgi:hypothetical protein
MTGLRNLVTGAWPAHAPAAAAHVLLAPLPQQGSRTLSLSLEELEEAPN